MYSEVQISFWLSSCIDNSGPALPYSNLLILRKIPPSVNSCSNKVFSTLIPSLWTNLLSMTTTVLFPKFQHLLMGLCSVLFILLCKQSFNVAPTSFRYGLFGCNSRCCSLITGANLRIKLQHTTDFFQYSCHHIVERVSSISEFLQSQIICLRDCDMFQLFTHFKPQ
jgi:hypothetical protein